MHLHLTCHHDGLGVAVLPEGAGPLAAPRPRGGDQAGVCAAGRQRGPAHSQAATPTLCPHRGPAAVVRLHGVVLQQTGGQGHGSCHGVVLYVFTCHVSSPIKTTQEDQEEILKSIPIFRGFCPEVLFLNNLSWT